MGWDRAGRWAVCAGGWNSSSPGLVVVPGMQLGMLGAMTANPTPSDWAAARGDKWASHLYGTEPMFAPLDEPLIAALQLNAPCAIAEVGCGGGGTSVEILRQAPAGSVLHAFDVSPSLIEVARARSHAPELSFAVADVATAVPAQRYQRLVSRLGIMFFDDPAAAFANLARWLEPGGRFAFLVWGPLSDNPWLTNVRDVVAQVIPLPIPDLEAPGPFRYADAGKLRGQLHAAGFADIEAQEWQGPVTIGGALPAAEAAEFALASFSGYGELLNKAGDAALAEARRLLTARFLELQEEGVIRLDACVRIFTGGRA